MFVTELFENSSDYTSISDITSARELMVDAIADPLNNKHKYFEFLKNIRTNRGTEYSTRIHQKAAQLAKDKA